MHAPSPPPSRPRVLVVDDDDLIRRSLERLLGGRAEVTSAESAGEARRLLGAGPFDIVVSDHAMPGETGLSLLGAVAEASPGVALVMFSALPPPEAYAARDEGLLDALFRKPDEVSELVDFVASAGAPPAPAPATGAGAAYEVDASAAPIVRVRALRPAGDDEFAEQLRGASVLAASGEPWVYVFEGGGRSLLTRAQHEAKAAWARRHGAALAARCLGIAYVGAPGLARFPAALWRHAKPFGIPTRLCASRDEAFAWARGRLAAGGPGPG